MARKKASKTPATADHPLRILHLSDLHFRKQSAIEAKPLLQGLVDTIRDLVQKGRPPDIVAITGDFAFSGKKAEFEMARSWIDKALCKALPKGFPKQRILIVPGNHDVDLDVRKNDPRSKRFLQDLFDWQKDLEYGEFQRKLNEYLDAKSTQGDLLRPQRQYLKFSSHYGPKSASKDDGKPWWHSMFRIRGIRMFVSGLCSSILAEGGRSDRGTLVIGQRQLDEVVHHGDSIDCDLRVVLLHHPWSWISGVEADEIESSVHARSHVVLTGHLHQPLARTIQYSHNHCVELRAGCAYDGSLYPNGFQLIEFNCKKRSIRVEYWTWSATKRNWLPDMTVSPLNNRNWGTFELAPLPPDSTRSRATTPAKRSKMRRNGS